MACMEGCLPGGTRPNTPHHHMGLWLQATVQMRLCRGCAQGGVWWKRVGGRAGARQGRTAQNSRRMFVFAATLVPRRRDIRHENVRERGTPGKLDVQRAPCSTVVYTSTRAHCTSTLSTRAVTPFYFSDLRFLPSVQIDYREPCAGPSPYL